MNNYVTQLPTTQGFNIGVLKNIGTDENPRYAPFALYEDPRTKQIWVAGVEGERYYLEFVVPDFGRYKAVTSIDGLSIMNGQKCTGGGHEAAWVMDAASHLGANVIPGWYQNGNSVAAFRFAKIEESYSALAGKGTENVGVIGARFYFERPRQPVRTRQAGMRGGNSRGLEGTSKGLGTEYGEEVEFQSSKTTFEVDYNRSPITVVLRYLPEAELIRAGMIPLAQSSAHTADPFPGAITGCQPPPGWQKRK